MLDIKILHNRECGFWREVLATVQGVLIQKNIEGRVEEVLVSSDEQAKKLRFFGSPQVIINGRDIDPKAETVTSFHSSGCRPFFYRDQFYDYPPREMIEEAIEQVTNE